MAITSTLSPMSIVRINSLSQAITLSVLAIVFLPSCQDDENINPLLGTWTLTAVTTQNCKDPRQNVTVNFGCGNSTCNKYTFSADGTLKFEHFTDKGITVTEGTYSISDATVVAHIAGAETPTTRTFNVDLSESKYLYLSEIFPYGTGKCSTTTVLKK
jgi:hypothetical protein